MSATATHATFITAEKPTAVTRIAEAQGCGASAPPPQKGKVIPVGGACRTWGWPRVKILSKGRRPWMICANAVYALKETKRSQRNRAVIRVEDMQGM